MRSQVTRKKISATEARNLRTLLLLNVFEPQEIGARIQQAREKAGLRQEDLADLIDVATRTVQNYEAGDTKPFAKLKLIAEATGTPVEWLLHGDPEDGVVAGLDADELRGRFEGLAYIVREQAAGITEEIRRLPRPEAPDSDLVLAELAALRAEVERLALALERRQEPPHEAVGP